MKRIEDLPDVLTVPQTAKFLGISTTTCYQQVMRGEIPHKRFGRRVIVPKRELATYLGYGDTPKIETRTPKRVVAEIAELARSMAEMNQRLARICEEIGGEYGGEQNGATQDESESAAILR